MRKKYIWEEIHHQNWFIMAKISKWTTQKSKWHHIIKQDTTKNIITPINIKWSIMAKISKWNSYKNNSSKIWITNYKNNSSNKSYTIWMIKGFIYWSKGLVKSILKYSLLDICNTKSDKNIFGMTNQNSSSIKWSFKLKIKL